MNVSQKNGSVNSQTVDSKDGLRCLADVEPEEIEWLWYPYIPLQHVTALEGDPGTGKSFVTHALATAVSGGGGPPGWVLTEPANTLLITAEDHVAATVRPRIEAMEANMHRIQTYDKSFPLNTKGSNILEELIQKSEARLVVIDPIVGFLPDGLDLHRANEVRPVMAGLSELAQEHQCAIVIVRHLAKGQSGKAIYRGLGSIDFTAACRSVLLVGRDANDPSNCGVVQTKSNLGPAVDGVDAVGYKIEEGRFSWTGPSSLTAQQILADEPKANKKGEAAKLVTYMLNDGPRPSTEIEEKARANGISKTTLHRISKELNVEKSKGGFQGASTWSLPTIEDSAS